MLSATDHSEPNTPKATTKQNVREENEITNARGEYLYLVYFNPTGRPRGKEQNLSYRTNIHATLRLLYSCDYGVKIQKRSGKTIKRNTTFY